MQRVLVIGMSGAGKSTLSSALAAKTGLPLIHLDREFWQPGWVVPARAQWRETVARLVAGERWVMDGNFDSSLDLRLPRADTLLWFDFPRLRCIARALKRVARSYGRVRPDMAPGCPERLDLEFLRYIWDFKRKQNPQILAQIARHGQHLTPLVFRRDRDALDFLARVPARVV